MQDSFFHCSLGEQITLAGFPLPLGNSGDGLLNPILPGQHLALGSLSLLIHQFPGRQEVNPRLSSHEKYDSSSPGWFLIYFKITLQEESTFIHTIFVTLA